MSWRSPPSTRWCSCRRRTRESRSFSGSNSDGTNFSPFRGSSLYMPVRRAQDRDIEAVAQLFRAARRACLPYVPDLHTPEDDLWFFRERVFAECDVWVAQSEGLDGFIAFRQDFVDHLYVRPDCQRRGIGKALLAL